MIPMMTLALRGLTVFPGTVLHFDVGREGSIKALEQCIGSESQIFLVSQRDISVEYPKADDLYTVGTVSVVKQILRVPGSMVRVMVEGIERGRLLELVQDTPCLISKVDVLETEPHVKNTPAVEALIRRVRGLFESYVRNTERLVPELLFSILSNENPGEIADHIAQAIEMRQASKQEVLEELNPVKRLKILYHILRRELEVAKIERSMQAKVRNRLTENQRTYILKEQMKAIREELGEKGSGDQELDEYAEKIEHAKLPEEAKEKLLKELKRLEKQPYASAEAAVGRNYLDVCLELPWGKKTRERIDVPAARKILDADHFGLQKVKERILEFLAVKKLAPELKGQILCFVGPPGVGKTSIAMSIGRAMNRKISRISLGGVHDEAEIRGHRKTYVGAMPGRILNGIRQAGSSNPLLVLDEIDKLGSDYRGDPASALLEVLDAEQNNAFRDHFLEIPYDLSDVLFITTANTTQTIPKPLLDRMELIELTSYTDEEKLQIAKRHIIKKEFKRHGIKRGQVKIADDVIREIITAYTKEAGVRLLEQKIAAICRKCAMKFVSDDVKQIGIKSSDLPEYLGVRQYYPEKLSGLERIGVVNGLAWTSVGGELLEVEVNAVPGSGKIELTGNLGDVMKESARAAFSYLRGHAVRLGLDFDFYEKKDIHVHFPSGAVPKDGPSAGIAIVAAMASALTNRPIRGTLAMTGEVSLRGRVLPIGGLKEKTMAALRNGMKTVMIPEENEKDLEEIDQTVRNALHFVMVEHVDAVLSYALNIRADDMEWLRGLPMEPDEAGSQITLKQ